MMSILTPKLRIPVSLGNNISSDPEVGKAYNSDPQVVKTITTRLAYEMINAVIDVKNIISKFKLPIFIQSGSEDFIARGLDVIKSRLKAEDQTICIYKGLRHEVYNELKHKREPVLLELVNWLNERV